MVVSTLIAVATLVILAAVQPGRSEFSLFELNRRSEHGDKDAISALARENLLADVVSLQRVLVALFLVITVLLCVATWGWLVGIVAGVLVAVEFGSVARLGVAQRLASKLYKKFEKDVLKLIKKAPYLFKLLRSVPAGSDYAVPSIKSRDELRHLVDESTGILTADEKMLIVNGLSFGNTLVDKVMTPRSVIDAIKSTEFLGPLTLDDLHKTGHSRLPVYKNDIDHIIGMLHLGSLLALDVKRSTTAEKAMEPKVYYIRQDQTLQHAMAAFLRTHHHLFVVVNEFRETVGLVSLEDVIEALLGRKIIDEFDSHDNLRQVALRNPRGNNNPEKHQDV